MTFNVRVNPNPETKIVAKVTNNNGVLSSGTPVTVKNQFREYQINSIEDLPNVDEINVGSGSTLVFNANTNKYEVKPLDATNITGIIDGGEF
jgi:hypothetical protein